MKEETALKVLIGLIFVHPFLGVFLLLCIVEEWIDIKIVVAITSVIMISYVVVALVFASKFIDKKVVSG